MWPVLALRLTVQTSAGCLWPTAVAAVAQEEHFTFDDQVAEALRAGQLERVRSLRMHVAQVAALEAHEVVVAVLGVGVVPRRPAAGVHLVDLAHRHQSLSALYTVARLTPGRRSPARSSTSCGEVDVVPFHDLGCHPPLRRQTPVQRPEALEKRRRGHARMYTSEHL